MESTYDREITPKEETRMISEAVHNLRKIGFDFKVSNLGRGLEIYLVNQYIGKLTRDKDENVPLAFVHKNGLNLARELTGKQEIKRDLEQTLLHAGWAFTYDLVNCL